MPNQYILKFSCPDSYGIIAKVTTFLSNHKAFICELSEFGDPFTKKFFLRCVFDFEGEISHLEKEFTPLAQSLKAEWKFIPSSYLTKTLILVSKYSHCLNDLLHRNETGRLKLDIRGIISNHPDLEKMANYHGVPFHYYPAKDKEEQEKKILQFIHKSGIDLVILARYMQILSGAFTEAMKEKIINIHHSFLPSFKGAKPYHQAFERGVKIIGATAHYVTQDLDEGPIIEQECLRVDHPKNPEELVSLGFDIEAQVLARAVKYHTENRIFLNGSRTIIFK